jgi:hypothetical protein
MTVASIVPSALQMVAGEFVSVNIKRAVLPTILSHVELVPLLGEWAEEIGEQLVLIRDRLVLIGERLVLIGDRLVLVGERLVSTLAIIQKKCEKVNFLSWLLKNLEAL